MVPLHYNGPISPGRVIPLPKQLCYRRREQEYAMFVKVTAKHQPTSSKTWT